MKRKLSLAMAIVSKPEIIILDEPTSGLDVQSREQVIQLIKNELKDTCTILLATQHLDEAEELSDLILILKKGEIIDYNTPQAIKQKHN